MKSDPSSVRKGITSEEPLATTYFRAQIRDIGTFLLAKITSTIAPQFFKS